MSHGCKICIFFSHFLLRLWIFFMHFSAATPPHISIILPKKCLYNNDAKHCICCVSLPGTMQNACKNCILFVTFRPIVDHFRVLFPPLGANTFKFPSQKRSASPYCPQALRTSSSPSRRSSRRTCTSRGPCNPPGPARRSGLQGTTQAPMSPQIAGKHNHPPSRI